MLPLFNLHGLEQSTFFRIHYKINTGISQGLIKLIFIKSIDSLISLSILRTDFVNLSELGCKILFNLVKERTEIKLH